MANLKSLPKLELHHIKCLRLSLAFRNDHFGARHFVKEQLPRIQWANPDLDIHVEKVRKTPQEAWRPEMELEFTDGRLHVVDMHEKWSTTILKELMDMAGGDSWRQWKVTATTAGFPVVLGEENENNIIKRPTSVPLPSLKVFRATSPAPAPEAAIANTPTASTDGPMPAPNPRTGARVLSL